MTNTPLNPDAIKAARLVYGGLTECEAASDCDECQVEAGEIIRAYLAVAQPEVNSFDPRELNRKGWTCGCEPGNYDECDDCLTAAHELANFLNRPEVKP